MANASFGKSLKKQGAISTDKLENILNTYPDISPMWLLKGIGDMIMINDVYQPIQETAPTYLLNMITEKDTTIREQAVEIGQLRERIKQLEQRLGKTAGDASIGGTANVG